MHVNRFYLAPNVAEDRNRYPLVMLTPRNYSGSHIHAGTSHRHPAAAYDRLPSWLTFLYSVTYYLVYVYLLTLLLLCRDTKPTQVVFS